MRVSQIRGTFLGVPKIWILVFSGLHWGHLILGNYLVENEGHECYGLEFRGFGILGLEFRVQGFWGSGFRVGYSNQ